MSWWRKRLGSKTEATSFPVTVPLAGGQLAARVYAHEIVAKEGRVPCWSYVSDGLRERDHAEVVFTLRREPDEDVAAFPEDPCRLFEAFYEVAGAGHRVTAGGHTELAGKRCFGHHLLYADAQPLDGVELPPGCLAALMIDDDELRAVKQFGPTRVLARLGYAIRHYPFQPWSERGRRGLSLADTFEHSLLSKIGIRVSGQLTATLHDRRITLCIERAMADDRWDQALSTLPDAPLAFLTLRAPDANACLVWEPGQREAVAISPSGSDGSRVAACFVIALGERPADGCRLFEDGFVIELTDASWAALRGALRECRDLVIPATLGEYDFALTWRDSIYPDDPDTEREALPDELSSKVVLLVPESTLGARVEADALASHLDAIHQEVATAYARHEIRMAPLGLFVVVKPPNLVRVWAEGIDAPLPAADAALLEQRVSALAAPDVRGPLVFACAFPRKGTDTAGPPPLPLAWRDAARTAGGELSIPDGLLAAVWPD